MSYLRTFYTDAAARASNFNAVSTYVPTCLHGESSGEHVDTSTMPKQQPSEETAVRMPSRRPIDHRWDQSRGLVFKQPTRSVLRDYTWSPQQRIVFTKNDGARRTYAMRPGTARVPPPTPARPAPGEQSPAKQIYGSGVMPSLERGSVASVEQAPKGSKKEEMEMQLKARSTRIQTLENTLAAERAAEQKKSHEAQVEIEVLKRQIKDLKKELSDDKSNFYQRGYDKGIANTKHLQAERIASLEKSMREAEQRKTQAEEAKRSVEATHDSLKSLLEQEKQERATEVGTLKAEVTDEKTRFEHDRRELREDHAWEVQRARDNFEGRKGERKEYQPYRDLFDKVTKERVVLDGAVKSLQYLSNKALEASEKSLKRLQEFCAKNSGTAGLGTLLEQAARERASYRKAYLEELVDMRQTLIRKNDDFKAVSHDSRQSTYNLRFKDTTIHASVLEDALRSQIERPLTSIIEGFDAEGENLSRQIKGASSSYIREELEERRRKTMSEKYPMISVRRLTAAQRMTDVLEAWRDESYVEKAVFAATFDLQNSRDAIYKSHRDQLDALSEDRTRDAERADLGLQYHLREREVLNSLDAIRSTVRKQAQLREILDPSKKDEHERKVDAAFQKRLNLARSDVNDRMLAVFGQMTGARKRSTTGAATQAASRPRISSPEASSRKPSAFAPRDQRAASKSRPERVQALRRMNLLGLQEKRASLADSDPQVAKIDREIQRIESKVQVEDEQLASGMVEQPGDPNSTTPGTAGKATASSTGSTPSAARRARFTVRRTVGSKTYIAGGVRHASTSTKPPSHLFGAKRQMHDSGISEPLPGHEFDGHLTYPVKMVDQPELSRVTEETRTSLVPEASVQKAVGDNDPFSASSKHTSASSSSLSANASDASIEAKMPTELEHMPDSDLMEPPTRAAPDASAGTSPVDMLSSKNDTPLRFQIPTADFRTAITASSSSSAAFWKYNMYKDEDGNSPTRHYCTNYEQTEAQAAKFKNEKVLGFDIEWEIGSVPGKSNAKRCVSLIQVAAEDKIGLFHISLFKGSTMEELMPPSLRHLLESQQIVKAGVNVGGDATRIEKCLGVKMQGLFELSHLYKVVMFSEKQPHKVNKGFFNMAAQVQSILHLPLAKGAVRTSSWSKRLENQQVEYAASDAYAGICLFYALEAKRKAMSPMPPRPAFWELKLPLILGNGHAVVPRSQLPKQAKDAEAKATADDDAGDDVFYDAVEEQPPSDTALEAAGVPLAGLQVSYPSLPPVEDLGISDPFATNQDAVEKQTPTDATGEMAGVPLAPLQDLCHQSGPDVTITRFVPSGTAKSEATGDIARATSWADSYRGDLAASGRNSKVGSTYLRAYHLWHIQNIEPKTVATVLSREWPLQLPTVITYIVEACTRENLDYDVERMKEVVQYIPTGVRWRYAGIFKRVNDA